MGTSPGQDATIGPASPTASAVGVHAHEFRLTLTRSEVQSGQVVIELANEGEDPHNLQLAPLAVGASSLPVDNGAGPLAAPDTSDASLASQASFPTLSAGQRQTKAITLSPGIWRLWCSLPGHDAAGMHAVLKVVG